VASLSQGRTAAAQCGLFTYKSVPVIFEPPCTINCAATSLTLLEITVHSPVRIQCTDGTHLAWRANPPWRRWQLLVLPHCRALPPPPSSVTNAFVSNHTKYQQTWNNLCNLRRAVKARRYSAHVKHLMALFQSRYFCGDRWEARKSKITTTGINRLKTYTPMRCYFWPMV